MQLSEHKHIKQETQPDSAIIGNKPLYIAGAYAALIALIVFRRNLGVEYMTFNGFGLFKVPSIMPVSAMDWFTLLNGNWYIGLTLLNVFDMVNYALLILVFLALFAVLSPKNKGAMVIATAFALIGIMVNLTTNQAFSMLNLSHQFAAATSNAQKAALLSTGEALLAISNPGAQFQGTGYYMSLFFVLLAGLIDAIVMLKSNIFSRTAAITGILANALCLGYFMPILLLFTQVELASAHTFSTFSDYLVHIDCC